MGKRLTQEQFIERYSKDKNLLLDRAIYVDDWTSVEVGCKKCGHYRFIFIDALRNKKYGCKYCAMEALGKSKHQKAIEKAKERFSFLEYDKDFEFLDNSSSIKDVKIKCKYCGKFYNLPKESGFRCFCMKYNTETFFEKLTQRYPNHSFELIPEKTEYVKATSRLWLYCNHCKKEIYVNPNWLLFSGRCPKCTQSGWSITSTKLWDEISKELNIFIQHNDNFGEKRLSYYKAGKRIRISLDGYDKEHNIAFEYYGSRFHGDLRVFKEDEYSNPFDKINTAKMLYKKTLDREKTIRGLGIHLISIWEKDYLDNPELVKQNIIKEVKGILANEN